MTALGVFSSLSGQGWSYVSRVSMADWSPRRRWTAFTLHPRSIKEGGVEVPEIVEGRPFGWPFLPAGAVPHLPGGVAA